MRNSACKHQTDFFRVLFRICRTDHAEASKAGELPITGIDGQGGKLHRHTQIRAFHRPHQAFSRPCIALVEQGGNAAIRIEAEDIGDIGKAASDDIGCVRPDRRRKIRRYFGECAIRSDLPDEARGRRILIEHEIPGLRLIG